MSRQEDTVQTKNIRIAVLGSKSVGKTHLIKKIIGATYEEYIPSYSTTFQIKNIESKSIVIKYYDFSPVATINLKQIHQYQHFDAVINLFKDSESFQEIYNFWQQIKSIEQQRERQSNKSQEKNDFSHFSTHLKYVINIFKKQQQDTVQIQYDQIFEYLIRQISELKTVQFKNIIFDEKQDQSFSRLIAQIQSDQILDACSWTYAFEDEQNDQEPINLNLEGGVVEQKSEQRQVIEETKGEQIVVFSSDVLAQNTQQLDANVNNFQQNTATIQQKQVIPGPQKQQQHYNPYVEEIKQYHHTQRHTYEQLKLQDLHSQVQSSQTKQFLPSEHLQKEELKDNQSHVQIMNQTNDMAKQAIVKQEQKQKIVVHQKLPIKIYQQSKNQQLVFPQNIRSKQQKKQLLVFQNDDAHNRNQDKVSQTLPKLTNQINTRKRRVQKKGDRDSASCKLCMIM